MGLLSFDGQAKIGRCAIGKLSETRPRSSGKMRRHSLHKETFQIDSESNVETGCDKRLRPAAVGIFLCRAERRGRRKEKGERRKGGEKTEKNEVAGSLDLSCSEAGQRMQDKNKKKKNRGGNLVSPLERWSCKN